VRKTFALTTACLLAFLAGKVNAQSVPRDVQELRRAHQLDEDDRYPIPDKQSPAASQPEKLYDTRYPFVCMGTDPWRPVYAKPDYASRIPNWLTQSQVAVTGNPINGFLQILYYNGKPAFIPASSVHGYRGINNPDATCTFAGKDASGRPIFTFNVPPRHQ
jgi:hypothetical protein